MGKMLFELEYNQNNEPVGYQISDTGTYTQEEAFRFVKCRKVNATEEEFQAKLAELEAGKAMMRLKEERNRRIAESDWRFLSDQTPSQAWIDYRQALRDLPANSTPELDENGNLINVNWPVEPTE